MSPMSRRHTSLERAWQKILMIKIIYQNFENIPFFSFSILLYEQRAFLLLNKESCKPQKGSCSHTWQHPSCKHEQPQQQSQLCKPKKEKSSRK